MQKRLVVDLRLVGIIHCEIRDGFNKSIRSADIPVERDRIARACMAAGQQFTANLSVLRQSLALQIFYLNRRLVVIQLANQVLAIVEW